MDASRIATSAEQPVPRRIHLLATGGTIAGTATAPGSGSYISGRLGVEDMLDAVPRARTLAHLSGEQVSTGGSQDMSERIWRQLAGSAETALADPAIDGLVITHGTDTLEETAFFLSLVLPSDKPVVLTAAARNASAPGADGPANLIDAIAVAADPDSRGVSIVFDGTVFAPHNLIRTHIRSTREFGIANGGVLGLTGNGRPHLVVRANASPSFKLPADTLPEVAIVLAHVGASPAQVENAVRAGARGIVLAGTGNGNAARDMLAALAFAVRDGIAVVRASRISGPGWIERNVEIDDDEAGFATAAGLDAFKARILLQLLLSSGITDVGAIQQAFERHSRPEFVR